MAGMVLDWMSHNLYWTDQSSGSIWVKNVVTGYSKQVLTGLLSPYAVEWVYESRFRGCKVCKRGVDRCTRGDVGVMGYPSQVLMSLLSIYAVE